MPTSPCPDFFSLIALPVGFRSIEATVAAPDGNPPTKQVRFSDGFDKNLLMLLNLLLLLVLTNRNKKRTM
jgi:hypothetical protein